MSDETIVVVVRRRSEQGHAVVVLDLAAMDGGALPPFDAGSHVDVHLEDGMVRQYSLCGDPARRDVYRLGILKDPASRGGSAAAHASLREGVQVRVGLPRNQFALAPGRHRSILFGGGIGVTPMIAMAYSLHAAGRPFELHYCGRSEAASAFLDELRQGPFAQHVHTHFDDGDPSQRLDPVAVLRAVGADLHVYVCGPGGFMDWIVEAARCRGLTEAQVHKEHFQRDADTSGRGFEVVAKRSGKRVHVAAGQTIVEALAAQGIRVRVSCEQGICGTCICGVLAGVPDHRDVFLTEEEHADNDQIALCCSRSHGDELILDI